MASKSFLSTFILLILLTAGTAFCQTQFEVPQNIVLRNPGDYAKYDTAIINAAKWLEENDLDKEAGKRQATIDFVLRWLEKTPAVTLEMTEPMSKLYDNNDSLLGIFLASYSRNVLENKSSPSKFNATRAAVISMMTVYKKGISITKNKQMERAIKMANENKLDEYITGVMRVQKD